MPIKPRKMTPEELRKVRAVRKHVADHLPELEAKGREALKQQTQMVELLKRLKATREAAGLSLTDVAERSGIDKANLSKLENDAHPNPTWTTVCRIAAALGVTLTLGVKPNKAA